LQRNKYVVFGWLKFSIPSNSPSSSRISMNQKKAPKPSNPFFPSPGRPFTVTTMAQTRGSLPAIIVKETTTENRRCLWSGRSSPVPVSRSSSFGFVPQQQPLHPLFCSTVATPSVPSISNRGVLCFRFQRSPFIPCLAILAEN